MAAVVLAALALAGCTREAPTTPRAPTTTDAPPTATPTATLDARRHPEPSPALDQATEAGAAAAATYFLQLHSYAFATGDVSEWAAMSSESCGRCAQVQQDVEAMTAAVEIEQGPPMVVESTRATEVIPAESFSVVAVISQGPTERIDRSGRVVGANPLARYGVLLVLDRDDAWRVAAYDVQSLPLDGQELPEDLRW